MTVITGAEVKDKALSWMREGEYARAGEAFSAMSVVHPDVAGLWFYAGQCAELMGEYAMAADAFRGAIQAHKRKPGQRDRARCHFSLGSNLFRLGKDLDAELEWRAGLRGECDTPEALFVRSQVRFAMNDYCYTAWSEYEQRRSLPGWNEGLKGHGVDVANLPPEWSGR